MQSGDIGDLQRVAAGLRQPTPEPDVPVSCDRHQVIDELAAALTAALNTRGQASHSYRDDIERDLIWQAAAQATRSLGRPTRTFDKPGRIHLLVTNWGNIPL